MPAGSPRGVSRPFPAETEKSLGKMLKPAGIQQQSHLSEEPLRSWGWLQAKWDQSRQRKRCPSPLPDAGVWLSKDTAFCPSHPPSSPHPSRFLPSSDSVPHLAPSCFSSCLSDLFLPILPTLAHRALPRFPFFLPSPISANLTYDILSASQGRYRQLQRPTSLLHICIPGLGHHAEARALKLQKNLLIFSHILPEVSSFPMSAQNSSKFGSSCAKPCCLPCQPVLSRCFFVLFYPTDCLHLLSLALQLNSELSEARTVFSCCVFVARSKRRSSFKIETPGCFCRMNSNSFNKCKLDM